MFTVPWAIHTYVCGLSECFVTCNFLLQWGVWIKCSFLYVIPPKENVVISTQTIILLAPVLHPLCITWPMHFYLLPLQFAWNCELHSDLLTSTHLQSYVWQLCKVTVLKLKTCFPMTIAHALLNFTQWILPLNTLTEQNILFLINIQMNHKVKKFKIYKDYKLLFQKSYTNCL